MIKKILFLMLTLFTLSLQAQNVNISGTVVDKENTPLIGVNVLVKGTTEGTVTDFDGKFTVSGKEGQTLVFTYIGMNSQEIVYAGKPINVILIDDSKALEEVVVIGYQTVKKSDLTGAISMVKAEDMKKSASGTIANQLQGLATGVNVRSTGKAGEDASIEIRGVGTLSDRTPCGLLME